ncbi:MAG: ion channel protein [Crocinitomicaceae bacterium]|jgi:tetratricopeptide (TPR) repeat protein|nr:ion channel protein [Crocinitomicaceae bacterium]
MYKLLEKYTLLLFAVFFFSASYASPFDEGLKAYAQKDWSKAENLFRQHLISHQKDANAYFNVGSCLFQQENYAEAIWNFEKAFKLDPSAPDLQLLLDKSYQKAGLSSSWTPPVSYFKLKLFRFPGQTWSVVLLVFSLLTGTLLFSYFASGRKKLLLGLSVFSFMLWLFSCYIFYSRESFENTVTHAIVSSPVDMAYVSATGNALQDKKLKPGERLEIVEVKERVGLSYGHGETFWLDKSKVRLIE